VKYLPSGNPSYRPAVLHTFINTNQNINTACGFDNNIPEQGMSAATYVACEVVNQTGVGVSY